jgi:hypothetical protein
LRPTGGFYAPSSGDGVVVRVRYDDADGWMTNLDDGYIKTEQQIPFDRVDSFEEFGTEAADAAADVPAKKIKMPSQPQTGRSIVEDATPGLSDGEAIIQGVDEAFRRRGTPSPWDASETLAPSAPGISVGKVSDYQGPYYLSSIRQRNEKAWRDAMEIVMEMESDVVALDRSYYSPSNPRIRELFNEAAEANDWQPQPATNIYDPFGESSRSWFDNPDEDSIRAFANSLSARASSQVYANNVLLQRRMLRRIAEIDEATEVRGLIAVENARADAIMDLASDAYPMIQTDSELFQRRIAREGFMNQFQTGTSGGDLDFYNRVIAESAMLGIPAQLGGVHRPVYGFLGRIPLRGSADVGAESLRAIGDSLDNMSIQARRLMSPNSSNIEQYGNISVVFDRSKLQDATFTVGDSLGEAQNGRLIASSAAGISPDSVLTATAENLPGAARYFELQYINPRMEDVVAIYMREGSRYGTVSETLRLNGMGDIEIIVGAK